MTKPLSKMSRSELVDACIKEQQRSAALAAHVERGKAIMGGLCEKDFTHREPDRQLYGWYSDCPTTSLARRDARMKAEVLEEAAEQVRLEAKDKMYGNAMHLAAKIVDDVAVEYHRQSEEK